MSSARSALTAALVAFSVGAVLSACGEVDRATDATDATDGVASQVSASSERTVDITPDADVDGVLIELSDASPADSAAVRPPLAPTQPLADDQVQLLLSRVPALPDEADDQADFARRSETRPAPRPGVEIALPFPASGDDDAPDVVSGPLQVLRASPEGEVPLAPRLSLTFDQPMIALQSQDEAAAIVPVQLDPQPDGQWRWLGTRTLVFEPDLRFPMATEYTVTVPAGTASATGGALDQDFVQTFATPPVNLVSRYPQGGPTVRQPVILLGFDQAVDADAIQASVQLQADGQPRALRLATDTEVADDPVVPQQIESVDARGADRWVALRPTQPLPYNSQVDVVLPAGTPSAEGPRTTTAPQSFSFRTYGPFDYLDLQCGYRQRCRPGDDIQLSFSNAVDGEAFDPAWVTVQPEIPGMSVWASGRRLVVSGQKLPETTYRVRVGTDLGDVYDQSLSAPVDVTVETGAAEPVRPWLSQPGPELRVLDPAAPPVHQVYSMGLDQLKVGVWRVGPDDWDAYQQWRRHRGWYDRDETLPDPPGQALASTTLDVAGAGSSLVESTIDLQPFFGDDPGQLLVWVEAPTQPDAWRRVATVAWVQRTDIGLTALDDPSSLTVWATDLGSGAPLPDVELELRDAGSTARTDPQGLATLALPPQRDQALLVARRGEDLAIMAGSGWVGRRTEDSLAWYVFDDRKMYKPGETVQVKGWLRLVEAGVGGDVQGLGADGPDSLSWTLLDSRRSELAHGQVQLSGLGGFDLELALPDDVNLGTAQLRLDAPGFSGGGSGWTHRFEIQEFRRPEFEVSASVEPGPAVLGETLTATVSARYYAGGPLPAADTTWRVTPSWGSYRPPNQDDYRFGQDIPWWMRGWWPDPIEYLPPPPAFSATTDAMGDHHLAMHFAGFSRPRPVSVQAEAVVMDVNRQAWAASTKLLVHPASVYVGLRSDRSWVESGDDVAVDVIAVDLDGHPVAGRPVQLKWWTTRWKRDKQGAWSEQDEDVQDCMVDSAGAAGADPFDAQPVSCEFTPASGGRYTVQARVEDAQGRVNETRMVVWVAGDTGEHPRDRGLEHEQVVIVPDKDSYQPGDVAELMVQSPFGPARGLLSLHRSGLVQTRVFEIQDDSTVLTVPITDDMVPGLELSVELVGSKDRRDPSGEPQPDLPPQPAFAGGKLDLSVPPVTRTLSVDLAPADAALEPGGSTSLDLVVTDHDGKPVADAELAIVVVDEAVLALTGYRIADPLAAFYSQRGGSVDIQHLRSLVWLGDPLAADGTGDAGGGRDMQELDALGYAEGNMPGTGAVMAMEVAMDDAPAPPPSPRAMAKSAEGRAGVDENTAGPAIALRTDFRALALFLPAEHTDRSGKLTVPLTLPDSLTRYRITAVAVSGGQQFGSAEANITARKPLMLRPSAPRFLNFGDHFELPLVVQNQTDQDMDVMLAAGASNLRFIDDVAADVGPDSVLPRTAGLSFSVPANDRVEVRLPATTRRAGTARFQVALSGRSSGRAKGREATDAAGISLPVWTPATSEAFATYGEIGGLPPEGAPAGGDPDAIQQPVQAPADVWPQYGGLEITTASTALQALTDAVLYLVDYPYECAEQRASRVLAVAALRDVLSAFDAQGLPAPDDIRAAVDRDLVELSRLQNPDGGWGFWRRGDTSWPFVSLHVAHALARAQDKGFIVSAATRDRSLSYLRSIRSRVPADYPESVKDALEAYALAVRKVWGDADPDRALALYQQAGIADVRQAGLSMEALGWILPSLDQGGHDAAVAAILRHFQGRIADTAAGATLTTSYGEGDWLILHSDRRTDAVVLDALIQVKPRHDVVPKLVRSLLDHRVKGRWGSTQENAWVLLALDRYFNVYESETPDFVARAWLGDQYAGEHEFRGRSTEHVTIDVPMATVIDQASDQPAPLVLQKDGPGRLYYRLGLRYAPRDLDLQPADRGFVVLREYAPVDDDGDVQQLEDGSWRIRAGARVRVKLTMVADSRRTHVALVDPLPAGLEVINPELAVSEEVPVDDATANQPPWARGGGYWWWWRPWYEHENIRDERVEAFSTLLWAGVHDYSYVARATTPGRFVVPPAKAEEMYHPETFGRSGTDRVIVE